VKLIPIVCPKCGAAIDIDPREKVMACVWCRSRFANEEYDSNLLKAAEIESEATKKAAILNRENLEQFQQRETEMNLQQREEEARRRSAERRLDEAAVRKAENWALGLSLAGFCFPPVSLILAIPAIWQWWKASSLAHKCGVTTTWKSIVTLAVLGVLAILAILLACGFIISRVVYDV
jgi:hypothetical protein